MQKPNFNNLDKFVHKCNNSQSQVILEKREAVAMLRYTLDLQEKIIQLQDEPIRVEYDAGDFS